MNDSQKANREAVKRTIDDAIKTLCNTVATERASEEFQRYLVAQAAFHDYSWNNVMLIISQRADASRVAGYRTWQKLGRQVRKGERGLMIVAPRPFTRENASTGEKEGGISFRVVRVFDIAQTDGEELPKIDVPDIETRADAYLAHLIDVARTRNIPIEFAPIEGSAYGSSHNGRIKIDNTHSTGQQAKTLAHELAHEALHWQDRGEITRSIAELEAESVAFVVSQHFGLDCELRCARYIALWAGDEKGIRESLKRISTVARGIIDATADKVCSIPRDTIAA